MKERPILFSGPMVRALLSGAKTVTRRVVQAPRWAMPDTIEEDTDGSLLAVCAKTTCLATVPCPYGVPGDRLWVRETWTREWDDVRNCWPDPPRYLYRADGENVRHVDGGERSPWCPSIHMPRGASRLTLEVTAVRAERLHAITAADVVAEGVQYPVDAAGHPWVRVSGKHPPCDYLDPLASGAVYRPSDFLRAHFASLWDGLNHARAPWASNPWVYVVGFRRIEAPR